MEVSMEVRRRKLNEELCDDVLNVLKIHDKKFPELS